MGLMGSKFELHNIVFLQFIAYQQISSLHNNIVGIFIQPEILANEYDTNFGYSKSSISLLNQIFLFIFYFGLLFIYLYIFGEVCILGSRQGLLLDLFPRITLGIALGTICGTEIKPRVILYKASTLTRIFYLFCSKFH